MPGNGDHASHTLERLFEAQANRPMQVDATLCRSPLRAFRDHPRKQITEAGRLFTAGCRKVEALEPAGWWPALE